MPPHGNTSGSRPRITLVTPSFNQGQFIEETIRSVLDQNYPDLEYIIIDGGSTDESVEIIGRYENRLAYWCSEKDNGQADAINKGFARATGSLLGWINSDDLLSPHSLDLLAEAHARNPDSLIAGDVINFDSTGDLGVVRQKGLILENYLTAWKQVWEQRIAYHQPGVFFPKSAWNDSGPLDPSLNYCFDSDLMYRLLRNHPVFYLHEAVARFRLHPNSKTVSRGLEFETEGDRVMRRYWAADGGEADLKSYSRAAGAGAAAWLKRGCILKSLEVFKRGVYAHPMHAFFGLLAAIVAWPIPGGLARMR